MRRALTHLFPLISMLLLFSAVSYGQAWSGILDPARGVDWTKAGVPGGIPTGWANCTTTQCNTVLNGTVTGASITAALASAPNQTVVRIPAGNFTLSGSISTNRSNVILRGAGPTQTSLNMTGGANLFFGATGTGGGGGEPNLAATNITSGLNRGSSVIGVASTSGLTAGMQVGIDQLNDTNNVFVTGNEGALNVNRNGTTNFDGSNARAQAQLSEIKAVCTGSNAPAGFGCTAANQLAIDPPLVWTLQSSLTPQVYSWTPHSPQYIGVENVKVDANGTQNAVNFSFCSYCWAKNIEVDDGAHTEVHFYFNYRSELRDSYLSEPDLGGGPTQYGIEVASSTLVKIENNIEFNITSSLLPATSVGLVVGYNYAQNITSGNQFADYESHGVHNMFHLWEGNVVNALTHDNVWGSHSHSTMFRNRSSGDAPNKTNFRTPISIGAHQRYMNLIGNVLGTTGFHTVYQKDDTNENGADNFIYQVGFWNRWDSAQTPYDTLSKTSLMRWGNWDSVTNGVRWVTSEVPISDPLFPNALPGIQTLPASFYLNGKPAWFGNVPFPAIGPDVACTSNCVANAGNHAAKIPAQLCYESTAKDGNGYLTGFDANVCYASGSGGGGGSTGNPPSPPTGLGAVVQ